MAQKFERLLVSSAQHNFSMYLQYCKESSLHCHSLLTMLQGVGEPVSITLSWGLHFFHAKIAVMTQHPPCTVFPLHLSVPLGTSPTWGACTQLWGSTRSSWRSPRMPNWFCWTCPDHPRTTWERKIVSYHFFGMMHHIIVYHIIWYYIITLCGLYCHLSKWNRRAIQDSK